MTIDQRNSLLSIRVSAIALSCLALQACCSPDIKPDEANIFQAACGVSSGQYEDDLEKTRAEAQLSREQLKAEEDRSKDLQSDLKTTQFRHQRAEAELQAMEQQNQLVAQKIKSMSMATEKDKLSQKQKIDELQRLNADIAGLKANLQNEPDNPQHLEELEALKQEVETLRMIVMEQ